MFLSDMHLHNNLPFQYTTNKTLSNTTFNLQRLYTTFSSFRVAICCACRSALSTEQSLTYLHTILTVLFISIALMLHLSSSPSTIVMSLWLLLLLLSLFKLFCCRCHGSDLRWSPKRPVSRSIAVQKKKVFLFVIVVAAAVARLLNATSVSYKQFGVLALAPGLVCSPTCHLFCHVLLRLTMLL